MTGRRAQRSGTRALAGLVAAPLMLAACASPLPRSSVNEVIDAELAFARLAEEIGVRPAFAASFAEDAVWMVPEPTTLAAAHAARPPPADPRAVRLEWHPAIAGIARSGELGFTSGPSTLSLRDGSRPPAHSAYFSIWKRSADGRWRVALDAGVRSSTPLADAAFGPSPAMLAAPAVAQDDIAPLSREHRSAWNAEALLASSSDDVRMVHDAGIVRGSREIAATLRSGPLSLEPIGGGMSQSADLAYTYGRYACDGASGHYVHLWMRGPRGEWKLAMIVRP